MPNNFANAGIIAMNAINNAPGSVMRDMMLSR